MEQKPENKIAKQAKTVWRIHAFLSLVLPIAALCALFFLRNRWSVPELLLYISTAVLAAAIILFIVILPSIRWRRWRYQVFEQEIYIQHGIFIVSQTIVPMIRVQHVDTQQGPIMSRFKLATVAVSTAAAKHEIPALQIDEAIELRNRISRLARVEEDDV